MSDIPENINKIKTKAIMKAKLVKILSSPNLHTWTQTPVKTIYDNDAGCLPYLASGSKPNHRLSPPYSPPTPLNPKTLNCWMKKIWRREYTISEYFYNLININQPPTSETKLNNFYQNITNLAYTKPYHKSTQSSFVPKSNSDFTIYN